ncbi:MAG: 50S ribosome-binding GTPase [Sedimentisphaerales bacterium]|nr:50S ribosome-binding GTPase [Sedimentisphaerales bacterium]
MALYAAAMTGKGIGAIATVQIFGDDVQRVLAEIFKPVGSKPAEFKTGKIPLGSIVDRDKTIDQVTIGCEGPQNLAIHCHGNPLVVEMIMELLRNHGAELISAEEFLRTTLAAQGSLNAIAIEAKLAQLNAKTLTGTKILANQIDGGLTKWLENAKTAPLDRIAAKAEQILADSGAAELIISGCKIVLAGPPNSGKSTLLNRLAGRQKAIVTDIEGTTRDWVSAQCQIGPLSVMLIDTAGLDEKLTASSGATTEKTAQEMTARILTEAELILLVLDNSKSADQLNRMPLGKIAAKKVLTALNKADLLAKFDAAQLPNSLSNAVEISAKSGAGIENLKKAILQIAGVSEITTKTAVAFTPRQQDLLKQLTTVKSKQQTASIISELLNGSLGV